ncbi:MAG: leucine-rich repeat domain-containing protein [Alphaproteobacteria bacterium]|nr:leucine-rich repeat domain-containing protein [Alphaproteobacteria bacterium]
MKKLLFILSLFLSFNTNAKIITGEPCGDECTWSFDTDTGELTISGNGAIKDYTFNYEGAGGLPTSNPAPWYQNLEIRSNITKLVIEEGITSIGHHAFEDTPIQEVVLPSTITSIGWEAFANNSNLQKINLPEGLTSLSPYTISSEAPLSSLILPSTLTQIYSYTLPYKVEELVIPENVTYISDLAFSGLNAEDSQLKKLYCSTALADQCAALVASLKDTSKAVDVVTYQKTPDGQVFYNSKWYASANDIALKNNIKKRIYTIDEANKITKPTGNRVKIKYR